MTHQKRANPRKLEHLTSVLHDSGRPVSQEDSPCSLKPQEKTQRKTHRSVIERGIGREAGGASEKSRNDRGSTKDAGEISVVERR
jgi:hypothetical protein